MGNKTFKSTPDEWVVRFLLEYEENIVWDMFQWHPALETLFC